LSDSILTEILEVHFEKLDAGGKPSTWFPPGRLVEHIERQEIIIDNPFELKLSYFSDARVD